MLNPCLKRPEIWIIANFYCNKKTSVLCFQKKTDERTLWWMEKKLTPTTPRVNEACPESIKSHFDMASSTLVPRCLDRSTKSSVLDLGFTVGWGDFFFGRKTNGFLMFLDCFFFGCFKGNRKHIHVMQTKCHVK